VNESNHNNNVPATAEIQRLPVLEDEARWEEAAAKMALVKQVLSLKGGLSQAIAAVAAESGVGQRTLWYWLKAYRTHGITSLLDNRGRHLKGKSRLHPEAEKLTATVIASRGLTKQKRRPRKVHDALIQACVNTSLEVQPPSYTTVHRRMAGGRAAARLHRGSGGRKGGAGEVRSGPAQLYPSDPAAGGDPDRPLGSQHHRGR